MANLVRRPDCRRRLVGSRRWRHPRGSCSNPGPTTTWTCFARRLDLKSS